MVAVTLAFWMGVLIASLATVSVIHVTFAVAILIIAQRWLPPLQRIAHLPILLLFLFTGAAVWDLHHIGATGDALQDLILENDAEAEYVLRGRVEQPDIWLGEDEYSQFVLRVNEVTVEQHRYAVEGGVLVRWTNPNRPLIYGEEVQVQGATQPTLHRVNHGVRGIEHHYRMNNVHSSVRARGANAVETLVEAPTWSFRAVAGRARQHLAQQLRDVVPDSALPFTLTVWLGDRQRISNTEYTKFLESGTAHILAVSGVHIGLIYLSLSYGLRLFVRRTRPRIIITLAVISLFAFMAGARVSSLRAAIMIGLYLSAEWFEREPDAPTALSIAALVFGVQNPNVVFMPGFQLSFLSIASILLLREPLLGMIPWGPHWLREGLASVLSVQVLSLPAAVVAFHLMPVGGILANLIILPLLSIVLWLAALLTLTSLVVPAISIWFGHALSPVVWLIETIAETVAAARFSHLYVASPTLLALCGYLITVFGLLFLIYAHQKRHHAKWIIPFGLTVTILFWKPWFVTPNVTYLDVGHGDSAVIYAARNEVWLVDGGIQDDFRDMGKQVVAPYLWSHHIGSLEGIFVSHTDRDHLGGLFYIVDQFPVKQVFVPPLFEANEVGKLFVQHCQKNGVRVREISAGDRIESDAITIEVLHPAADDVSIYSTNDRSMVFTAEVDGITHLFTGDIEKDAESDLTNPKLREAGVIKVPHHGSATSSTPEFLDRLDGDHAIVSSGRRGDRPLAREEVLDRYLDRDFTVWRTDYGGSVRVHNEDGTIGISQARTLSGFAFRQEE